MSNKANKIIIGGVGYTIEDTNANNRLNKLEPYVKNYIGNYPFSKKALEVGSDKLIVAGYLDFDYEVGKTFAFSVVTKNETTNRIQLYKKEKDIIPVVGQVEFVSYFDVTRIEGSPYYLGKSSNSPKSWLILDWESTKTYDSLYDIDGIALSPSLFKNNGYGSKLFDLETANTLQNTNINLLKSRQGFFLGNIPFSQRALDAGVDKAIVDGYIDEIYEENTSYYISTLRNNGSNTVMTIYKRNSETGSGGGLVELLLKKNRGKSILSCKSLLR